MVAQKTLRPSARAGSRRRAPLESDPLWYKDAIFYELRVGAFQDSDDDGVGDFGGIVQRLDYLRDLGVTTLWLLPFYPSPLRDDGYDISDYTGVHPESGSLEDFKLFLREAHRRGLRVVTELVINHTSDQHPWFQRARRSPPGTRWRDYYVWSDAPSRYPEARIIFKDFEPSNWTWDPIAGAYFWHRFYSHQPDLNFDSPDVRREVLRVLDFWLGLGVDGLRLDAIPYLIEREGTSCENLPETHQFLRELRRHVDRRFSGRMLLAEANQWPEDAVAYLGQGDECHMAFHFPLMPRLFMAMHMEDRFPIIDILHQTPAIPESCQWALFLRNHDELTLEMVTDEERDYMYRVYAHDREARVNLGIRRRLAPLLGNDRRRIELMNALLFSLPGTPVIYYGDEIGMGDNFYLGDRDGVRTPMQWSPDRNAGFSRANPQRLYLPVIIDPTYHYESVNVETQQDNPHSLLLWMKRLIALRKRHRSFGHGSIEFLSPSNRKVLAFVRAAGDERILVVANLSRFVEYVELDLGAYRGMVAVELFGRKPFPPIGDLPYLLTLGPHSFYWFSLEARGAGGEGRAEEDGRAPRLRFGGDWERLLRRSERGVLEAVLPRMLARQGGSAMGSDALRAAHLDDVVAVGSGDAPARLLVLRVDCERGPSEGRALPVCFAAEPRATEIRRERPHAVLLELERPGGEGATSGILYDALEDPGFLGALLELIERRRRIPTETGELVARPTGALRRLRGTPGESLRPSVVRADPRHSSVVYGDRLVLKLHRRLLEGTSPDLELGRFLTERARFAFVPALGGSIELVAPRREPVTLGVLWQHVPSEGDAWSYVLDRIHQYFERALVRHEKTTEVPVPTQPLLERIDAEPPALLLELLGGTIETLRLLGHRTAELHQALASDPEDPAFAPEPFGSLYQRSLYQSLRNLAGRVLPSLRERLPSLPEDARGEAQSVLALEGDLLRVCHGIVGRSLGGKRIRCHGDFRLQRLLHTGSDFLIGDFAGEPRRSPAERRLKRSPLHDVAGMLRSFDGAVSGALFGDPDGRLVRPEDVARLEPWARFWREWVSSAFLRSYLAQLGDNPLLPPRRDDLALLLRVLLLEECLHEVGDALEGRPEQLRIPLRGILSLLHAAP